jgi:2-hydroxy-6-oxonona-2,4-dienedioate hydrolase
MTDAELDDKPLALPDVAPHPEVIRVGALATVVEMPLSQGRIVWRKWGAGPPLVLLHGGSGAWTHWIRNVEALSKHFAVWAPDLPGMGESDPFNAEDLKLLEGERTDIRVPVKPDWQPPPIPMPALARLLGRTIERLFPGQRVDITGFSFGGMTAANVAARVPHKVNNVVLVGSAGLVGRDPKMKPLLTWRFAKNPARLMDIQRRNVELLMLRDPSKVDDLAVNIHILNTRRTQSRKPPRELTTIAALERAKVGVHGIWGRFDSVSGWKIDEIRESFRKLDPRSQFHVAEQAGHWVAYEAADEFNQALIRILAQ